MTSVLHLPARADAPIACDMSAARDTSDERLAEYHELFARALRGRERGADSVVLRFDADARAQVEDLVSREHACCPFVDYRVEAAGDELIWTTTNPVVGEHRADVDVMLDALYALPDHAGSDLDAYLARLADRGVDVVRAGDGLEMR
jgi:hypothetical protein